MGAKKGLFNCKGVSAEKAYLIERTYWFAKALTVKGLFALKPIEREGLLVERAY